MRTLATLFQLLGARAGLRVWVLHILRTCAGRFSKPDTDLLLLLGRLRKTANHEEVECRVPGGSPSACVLLRTRSSDFSVYRQVFLQREYQPLIEFLRANCIPPAEITTIVDAGANIGLCSIFLNHAFPNAKIVAVEPEPHNCELLRRNIELNCGQQHLVLEAAVWPNTGWVKAGGRFRDGLQWSFQVQESCQETLSGTRGLIRGLRLAEIVREATMSRIDILKMDIEGGEAAVFSKDRDLDTILRKTRFVAIEIHDEFGSGPVVEEVLRRNGFIMFRCNETMFAANQQWAPILPK